jgi:predicted ATPase
MATTLIGRDGELGSIQAFLERVQHGPSALVLSGEPGIGKTVLWEAGVEQAGPPFGRVLSHRGAEAEALLSFAGLSELVTPVLEEVAPFVLPVRRRALEVALLLAEPGEEAADARAIGLAFLDVLQLLAQQSPVVVAVDDLQWLDSSSAAVLEMALRRLRHERVGFLATVREAPDVASPFDLDRSLSGHASRGVRGQPLLRARVRAGARPDGREA